MVETGDKLKFVGHFQRPFALLPNSPTVSQLPKAYGTLFVKLLAVIIVSSTCLAPTEAPEHANPTRYPLTRIVVMSSGVVIDLVPCILLTHPFNS